MTGKERFIFQENELEFSYLDFWKFHFSNIYDLQDKIAEFIVAKALGVMVSEVSEINLTVACFGVFSCDWVNSLNFTFAWHKLKKLLKENGLPIVTPHALRHTNASLMVNSGVDLKAVSAQLGHCNISITADTYGHIFDVYKAKIAKSIEDKLL